MKKSHFIALMRNDHRLVRPLLFLAISYDFFCFEVPGQDRMFDLVPAAGSGIYFYLIPFMMGNILFLSGFYGFKATGVQPFGALEFMFTRAIDRVSLFATRSALYLLFSTLPLVLILAHGYAAPLIRLELPYNNNQHREETKQFYLSHFEGAYLQEPDTGGNEDYVVLPQGRVDEAAFTVFFNFAFALLFQMALFVIPRKPWIWLATFFVIATAFSFAGLSLKTPSFYEASLAWVTQHTFPVFLGLALLTVATQLYCCRRFVATEITS